MLAERCGYFQSMFAESSTVGTQTPVVSFDFATVEQRTSFHHLLTFLYTDTCTMLTAGCRVVHTAADDASGKTGSCKSKRKLSAKDIARSRIKSADVVDDPLLSLKILARQFGVASLVKR